MALRAWDEGIATGVESIDAEHRLQVNLVNALEELLRRGGDPALAARTMGQLADFTSVHFLSEELMMRLYAYPHQEAHRAEHGRLTGQVAEIERRIASHDSAAALATIETLRGWLANHIKSMDQAFTLWCASNGIAAT